MRYKTFQATGIAPNGRLYAGDLNWIQDIKVDLSNFAQVVELAGIRIGEVNLQLLRYGPNEARLTGSLRVDGLLRGMGGFIPGTYTTEQRNAIPAGFAPWGTVILNIDKNVWEWNTGTDEARNWIPMGARKAVLTLGDGSTKDFRITHGFQTKDVVVLVRENATPWRQVFPTVEIEDLNYVDVTFAKPPAADAYRAVVVS